MKPAMLAVCGVLCATAMAAQGRGGRQGGGAPPVMRCLNPNIPAGTQIIKGAPTAEQYGVDPNNGVIIMRPNGDAAQVIQPCANFAPDDPFAKFLFPPELVMGHQEAIGLSEAQRAALLKAVVGAQTTMAGSQLKTAAEVERLQTLLQASTVDEAKVLEEVDRILALEREVKRAQVGMLNRSRNLLTEPQRAQLEKLREGPHFRVGGSF
jgi:hypothetical protein